MRRWLVPLFVLIAAPAWATLPSSGTITFNDVADELSVSHTGFSITSVAARTLAGVPSGAISLHDFYGKTSLSVALGSYSVSAGPSAPASHTFGALSCIPTGGSGSFTYTWTLPNQSSGTWTVSAGQGTASGTFTVNGVPPSDTSTTDVVCTVHDTVTGSTVASPTGNYSYIRT